MKRRGQKRPFPEYTFVDGPQLVDRAAFGRWFTEAASSESPPRIRLPILFELSGLFGYGFGKTFVGVNSNSEGLVVELTDQLGISLADYLRMYCPEKAPFCGLWIEGFPATTASLPSLPGMEATGPVFDVQRVVSGFVDGSLSPMTRGQVVATGGGDLDG